MAGNGEKLSIVVPVFNEEESIAPFLERMYPVIREIGMDYELIFAMDPSFDATAEVIKGFLEKDKKIKLITFSRRIGQNMSIIAGIKYSTGDVCIVMDCDLQDPPEVIPDMISKWHDGFEVVYIKRKRRNTGNAVYDGLAMLFYRIIGSIAEVDIPGNTGEFRLMDKKVVDVLKGLNERQIFLRGIVPWIGYRQTGIEIDRGKRTAGDTKYNFSRSFRVAVGGITAFSNFPLKISTYLGLAMSVFAFGLGTYYFIAKLVNSEHFGVGWTSLMVGLLFMSGVILVSLGIIGEYIARIYEEIKGRPMYIIDEVVDREREEENPEAG